MNWHKPLIFEGLWSKEASPPFSSWGARHFLSVVKSGSGKDAGCPPTLSLLMIEGWQGPWPLPERPIHTPLPLPPLSFLLSCPRRVVSSLAWAPPLLVSSDCQFCFFYPPHCHWLQSVWGTYSLLLFQVQGKPQPTFSACGLCLPTRWFCLTVLLIDLWSSGCGATYIGSSVPYFLVAVGFFPKWGGEVWEGVSVSATLGRDLLWSTVLEN